MRSVTKRRPTFKERHLKVRRGFALLMVQIAILILVVINTDMSVNEMVRYRLATYDRDTLKAEALAQSGVQSARLIVAVQAKLQPLMNQLVGGLGIPLPEYTVWKLIPLDSEILKGLISGDIQSGFGLDMSDSIEERALSHEEKLEAIRRGELPEDARDEDGDRPLRNERGQGGDDDSSVSSFDPEELEGFIADNDHFEVPVGGFGAFEGSFSVKIDDEERKLVSLRNWGTVGQSMRYTIAQKLYALFQPERYDFLFEDPDAYGERVSREELVANIFDWLDVDQNETNGNDAETDWGRSGGGSEDSSYGVYDSVGPRNDFFVSHGELSRVAGMSDAHMRAFADEISIYGDQKVNLLTADPNAIEALVRICAANPQDPLLFDPQWLMATVQGWFACKSAGVMGGCPIAPSPQGFMSFLQSGFATNNIGLSLDNSNCQSNIGNESKTFTIYSTGRVNDVERTVALVMRMEGRNEARYFYSTQATVESSWQK